MENKISVSGLAASLAQTTGKTKKLSEDFIREFFKVIAENVESGESMKIKGFGTFKVIDVEGRSGINVNTGEKQEIAPHKKVIFTPSKEMAALINAPFEEFQSVEMDDDMPDDIFYDNEDEQMSDEKNVSANRLEEGSAEENADDIITYEAYNEVSTENQNKESDNISDISPLENANASVSEYRENEISIETKTEESNEEETYSLPVYDDYGETPKSRFGIGFLTGALSALVVCIIVFMLGCFFDWWPVNFGRSEELIAEQQEVQEPREVDETQIATPPEEEPVYDTVSTTRYLTTIAREHYGDFNFWPYIYLENASILGHPDRITPGTKVIVPPLSKYGVDVSNKEDVAAAKQKGLEIYARYNK